MRYCFGGGGENPSKHTRSEALPPRQRKCFCPESLSDLTATSVTDTSFLVGWVVPEDSVRCGHTLDVCSTQLTTDHRYCSLNATGSQWQRTDLTPCSVYHVSAVLTVLTHTFPPRNLTVTTARPDDAMILSAQVDSVTTNEITLSWIPVYSGSPCALGYRLCWSSVGPGQHDSGVQDRRFQRGEQFHTDGTPESHQLHSRGCGLVRRGPSV
uniref:Fibronectin type-III domain-containing protein n=1 Tax=Timema cristinae TaxID=61476 RepID=A0A7R9DSC2_TIMCR|nr:unnamed protein product [Timema cristinae]